MESQFGFALGFMLIQADVNWEWKRCKHAGSMFSDVLNMGVGRRERLMEMIRSRTREGDNVSI